MKYLYQGIAVIAGLLLMVVLLISSVEYVAYGKDGYYEKQYAKYEVLDKVHMEMADLLYVTEEMMDYLKGDRADLTVVTEINGRQQEFFNEKEKRHMVDVQGLFLGAMGLRRASVLGVIAAILLLVWKKRYGILFGGIQWGIGIFLGGISALCILMSMNFNKYFTQFHLLFFDNDDWILNPKTDLLINIVPEGFFQDTAFWIAGIFLAGAVILWLFAGILGRRIKTGE